MQAVLQRFADSIPKTVYCADDLSRGSYKQYKEKALKHKYIQPQLRSKLLGWLIFDLDYAGAVFSYKNVDLPTPTLTIETKKSGHAHLLYQLATPVAMTAKSSSSAIKYVEAIERAYRHKLRADTAYAGLLTKNPLNDAWRVSANDVRYDLSELAEYVDLTKYRALRTESTESGGRNDTLFNTVRKSVYRIASKYRTEDSLFNETLAQCYEVNMNFANKLSEAELRSTAKSIAKYAFKNQYNLIISKEAINAIEIAAISIAHDLKLELSILDVCKLQQRELAKRACLSVDTVQRYMSNCAA